MKQRPQIDFLASAGEMGIRIAAKDWTKHPLGPVESWPQSLTSALSICLQSKFPMCIYWGEDMHLLYNDAWSSIPGDKHPAALGKPAREVWREIWDVIEPSMIKVFKTGEGTLFSNTLLSLERHGFTEEAYFDYTFSPIIGEDQRVAGIFNVGNEITSRTLSERRTHVLRQLSEKSVTPESPEAAAIIAANTLSDAPSDIPFSLIYLISNDGTSLRLAASSEIDNDSDLATHTINLTHQHVLPYATALTQKKIQLVSDIGNHYVLPGGSWDEPTRQVAVAPILHPKTRDPFGLLIVGISPRIPYDATYQNFISEVSKSIATSISNAYELRRKLNLEMREHDAQERLKATLAVGSIGVWTYDVKKNLIIADRNLARRFDVTEQQAREGLPLSVFTESIHPDDRDRIIKEINVALKKTKTFRAEYRTITRNGEVHWVLARGRVEDDEQGDPARFPGVIVDITDRKEMEQELASSEQMLGALFESNILGIAVATFDGKVHEANNTFLKMFGYNRKDIKTGLYSHMITPSKSAGVTSIIYEKIREKGELEPTEKEYIRKDGSPIPVIVGAILIPGADDRFIAYMLDISEQRQLRALNQAKDEFISIASHQLRTPATGVKQYLGMLLEGYSGELNDNQRTILNTAYQSNERQLAIVDDLLKVAQADADEVSLNIEKTDITKLLDSIINEHQGKFQSAGQKLLLNKPSSKVYANIDPFYIRMVFDNLIDNAHKYTPSQKTVTITVGKSAQKATISIKDQGIGIYKKDMPKLFKKFSRIENPLSSASSGTGLGLYWVQKIVDLHKGTISVSSRYQHGTEFVITL